VSDLKPDEVIPSIIAAAIAAAGPMGNNEGAWKAKINRAIPFITSMINDGSRQWKTAAEVLDAQVFTGSYVRHEIEESSTRTILYVDVGRPSDNYPDGIENISCQRTDNAAGKDQLARIERLEPGDELALWRVMEPIAGTNKSRRTLVHFETRPKRTQSPAGAPPVAPPAREQESGPPPSTPAPSDPPREAPLTTEINTERLNRWRAGAKSYLTDFEHDRLVEQLGSQGYDLDGVSEVEWDDIVRPVIRGIVEQREETS
jgi:hypothetical protein